MKFDAEKCCRGEIEKKITINYSFNKKKHWIAEIFIDFDKT